MKTKIVIKVYDIVWDLEGFQGKKPPKQVVFTPDLCELEDSLRGGDVDIANLIEDYLANEYLDTVADSYEWCFV